MIVRIFSKPKSNQTPFIANIIPCSNIIQNELNLYTHASAFADVAKDGLKRARFEVKKQDCRMQ